MKINIGGGLKRFEGFVNVDADPNTKPEYLHNLETEKLPFEDSTFGEIEEDIGRKRSFEMMIMRSFYYEFMENLAFFQLALS